MATLKKNMGFRTDEAVAEAMEGARDLTIRIMDARDEARKAMLAWNFFTIWHRKACSSNTDTDDDSESVYDDKKKKPGDGVDRSSTQPGAQQDREDVYNSSSSDHEKRPAHQDDNPSTESEAEKNANDHIDGHDISGIGDADSPDAEDQSQVSSSEVKKKKMRGKRGNRKNKKINKLKRKQDARAALEDEAKTTRPTSSPPLATTSASAEAIGSTVEDAFCWQTSQHIRVWT